MNSPTKFVAAPTMMAMVLEDLGLDATSEVSNYSKWIRWLFECSRDLGLPISFEIQEWSGVVRNGRIEKPRGFVQLRQGRLVGDKDGFRVRVIPVYRPIRIGLVDKCSENPIGYDDARFFLYEFQVEEHPHHWEFSSNAEGLTFEIEFKGYRFDEEGWPMLDTTFKDSYVAYCRYNWIRASRTAGFAQFGAGDEQMAKEDWRQFVHKNKSTQFFQDVGVDALNQVMAMVNDPFYVNLNPYVIQQNYINVMWANRGLTTSRRFWPR